MSIDLPELHLYTLGAGNANKIKKPFPICAFLPWTAIRRVGNSERSRGP